MLSSSVKILVIISFAYIFISPTISQGQIVKDYNYKKQIAVSTLEVNLEELRKVEGFEERVEITAELVGVLQKESPESCVQNLKLLFDDFLRLEEEDYKGADSFVEFQEKTAGKLVWLISMFDRELADKYLDKYLSKLKESLTDNDSDLEDSKLARIYLNIASQLLKSDKNYALAFAEKSLKYEVNLATVEFLALLHKKDNSLADDFCLKAIQAVSKRNLRDINESFVLYAYIFNASQVPAIVSGAAVYFPLMRSEVQNKSIDTNLVNLFLQTSIGLLKSEHTRNYSDASQVERGAVGDYFFLNVIEIQARKYAPNLLSQIENRKVALSNFLRQQNQNNIETFANNSNYLNSPKGYSKEDLLKKAESAKTPKQKDYFLYKAAMICVKEREFDEALKISDRLSEKTDESTKPYVKYVVARQLVKENEFEKALEIVKKDKDSQRKASIQIFSAKQIIKDKTKAFEANQLLIDAEKFADKETEGKELLLIGISNVYARFDATRALELWQKAINLINKKESFTGKQKLQKSFDEGNGFYTFYELLDSDLNYKSLLQKMSAKSFVEILQANQTIEIINFKIRANLTLCKKQLIPKA